MAVERSGTNQLLDVLERVADGGIQIAEVVCVDAPPPGEDLESSEAPAAALPPDRSVDQSVPES